MENKPTNNFISYVVFEEFEMQGIDSSRDDSISCEKNLKLLPGEVCTAEAPNVLMFSPVSDMKQGISGILCITNFKLTFITADSSDVYNGFNTSNGEEIKRRQQNNLLGHTDTCLTNIDSVYLLTGDKKKKLEPGTVITSKIKEIFIVCKNFRTWRFSFKFSKPKKVKTLLIALLHHAFPSRHTLLFGYDYQQVYYSIVDNDVKFFYSNVEWQNELDRLMRNTSSGKRAWRLSKANEKFRLSHSLPEFIVVPASVTDNQLSCAARHFQDNRPPVWSWLSEDGAALVKMSELAPHLTERTQENIMLENIRNSHPRKDPPIIIELSKDISIKSIAAGFSKFIALCSPENIRQFWIQDNSFYSLLESTKWLKYISYCLQKAVEASDYLNAGTSVILQETTGRDTCCIISSLVQLLLDPHFRTITGFQSLLQKEWIVAGHPFCDRLGHVINPDSPKSPLLLLFLDCVWQLCQQFPADFEFTETYLTTLWDTAHIPIFDTFLFNCERDRLIAAKDPSSPLVLRSVWSWREQFDDQDILLFYNPLFTKQTNKLRTTTSRQATLRPLFGISDLEFWSQCYFRWIPPLAICNGGRNQIEVYARVLRNDINQLAKTNESGICNLSLDDSTVSSSLQMNVDSFYPFSNSVSGGVSTPIMSSSMLMDDAESFLDSESMLTAPD